MSNENIGRKGNESATNIRLCYEEDEEISDKWEARRAKEDTLFDMMFPELGEEIDRLKENIDINNLAKRKRDNLRKIMKSDGNIITVTFK